MAKIGTAHIEIKPVLNEDALAEIARRVEDTIAAAVAAGMARGGYQPPSWPYPTLITSTSPTFTINTDT